jgi:hypothetical protein
MFGRSSSPRRNKLFAQHKALLVKSFKFLHVTAETIHLHRTFRTNADHLAPILHAHNEFELLIVLLHPVTQGHSQTRILTIEKLGDLDVRFT